VHEARRNVPSDAIVDIGIDMPVFDDYVIDTLMRDLVGHDHRPVSFLIYLWLSAEHSRREAPVQVSYQQIAESVGISKSSAQAAIQWLLRRKLISVNKQHITATPTYTVHCPWNYSKRRA
jgi:hypothetical protein